MGKGEENRRWWKKLCAISNYFPTTRKCSKLLGKHATHKIKSEVLIWHNFLFITSILNINFDIFLKRFPTGSEKLLGKVVFGEKYDGVPASGYR